MGFTIALQQIIRTRTATEEASARMSEMRSRLTTVTASGEVERAKHSLETTEVHVISRSWLEVRKSIPAVRQAFVRIRELKMDAFSDLVSDLDAAIIEMGEISDNIESSKEYQLQAPKLVRQYVDAVDRMQVRISQGATNG